MNTTARPQAELAAAKERTGVGQPRLRSEQADPGRLDWFTGIVLPDGGQRVRLCRYACSTPSGVVELDRSTSALLLAVLGELARADPTVS